MKKLILSVSMVLISLSGYPQTSPYDSSNNPSGVGFSGAMGGANNTSPTPPSITTPGSTVTPTVPRTTLPEQERQEELGNFAGGAMGGESQDAKLPSNNTVAPTRPNIPAATGWGTGAPTSY